MTDTIFNDENFIQAELPEPSPEQTPAPNEPKKRGRKPGGKNRPKEQQQQQPKPGSEQPAQQAAPNQRSIFDEIADDVKKNAQAQTQTQSGQPAPAPQPPIENLIDGYTVLLVMDIVIPGAIKFLFSKKFKGVDIAKIQMSKTQKESIEPLADKFAAYIQGYINPLYAFFIISSLMYYQNATDQLNKLENEKK